METSRDKLLLHRYDAAIQRRDLMRSVLKPAYELGCPDRDGFDQPSPGESKWTDIFDSTYADSIYRLANDLFTGMTPEWGEWFQLAPAAGLPKYIRDEIAPLLQDVNQGLRESLANGGFYSQAHESIVDLTFGTGIIRVGWEKDLRQLSFRSTAPYMVGLEPGANRQVAGFFESYRLLPRALKDEFPDASWAPEHLKLMQDAPDDEVEVKVCFYREGPQNGAAPWRQDVFILDKRCVTRRSRYSPNAVARWQVLSGEVYGRGPALKMSPTAWTLNEATKLMLMAANIAILGMWTRVDDGVVNPDTLILQPGAVIDVGSNDNSNPSLKPLLTGVDVRWSEFALDDLRSQVRRGLYVDDLGNVEGEKATATEIVHRQRMIARDKGAAYARIQTEFLKPVILLSYHLLQKNGLLPPVEVDGKVVELAFVSPLAKAQRAEAVEFRRMFLQDCILAADVDPAARALPKVIPMLRRNAEDMGIELADINTDEEVQKIVQTVAKSQAANAAAEAGGAPPPPADDEETGQLEVIAGGRE